MIPVSLIVIDPQTGFCSASSSLAKHYGIAEMRQIHEALTNLQSVLTKAQRIHLVTSEYSPGQFTNGNLEHPLANLCVPNMNEDCQLAKELVGMEFDSHSVKHAPSAMSCKAFNEQIQKDLEQGIDKFVIAGFLLEHCVSSTALDLAEAIFERRAAVSVCGDLSASRLAKYSNGEVEATIKNLRHRGVDYQPWQFIVTRVG